MTLRLIVVSTMLFGACSRSHHNDRDSTDSGTPRPDTGTEQLCFANLGGGCCGVQVGVTAGGRCLGVAIRNDACSARAPECGDACAAAVIPLSDGGAGEAPPVLSCHQDLGRGCCGATTVGAAMCDGACPIGTVPSSSCTSYAPACGGTPCAGQEAGGEGRAAPPPCFTDLGEGCCGELVTSSCGVCPPGSTTLCDAFFPSCESCADSGGDAPAGRFFPVDAGSPDPAADPISPLVCYEDLGAACCGVEVRPRCGTCPPGSTPSGYCRAFGDECSTCGDPTDCTLTSRTCCGTCTEPSLADVIAIPRERLADHRTDVCSDPVACPACGPVSTPSLIATCDLGTCRALDVRTLELSRCVADTDCMTRAAECCECGGGGVVAIRRDALTAYDALVCPSGDFDCPTCDSAPLPSAFCAEDGHCRVLR